MYTEKYFINRFILTAPLQQLKINQYKNLFTIRERNSKKITKVSTPETHPWLYYDYKNNTSTIYETLKDTGLDTCVFCYKAVDLILIPVFSVNEEANLISMIDMKFTCEKCNHIISLLPSYKMQAIKQLDVLCQTVLEGVFKSNLSSAKIIEKAEELKDSYAKQNWLWDFTYLKRRNMANIEIFTSTASFDYSNVKNTIAVTWSGVDNYDSYLKLISSQKEEQKPKSID